MSYDEAAHKRYCDLDRLVSRRVASEDELAEFGALLICDTWRGASEDWRAACVQAAREYNGTAVTR